MGRPLRGFDGKEQALPSWEAAQSEDWLGKWEMKSKSAASRRFVALSAARLKEWMASDLSRLDLLVIQIDGIS